MQLSAHGEIGVAGLVHACKSGCDPSTFDFYFGCSALEVLSSEKKRGKKDRAPFLVMKVPGTNMIMIHYNLSFRQDYSVPGFQFERLMTGRALEDIHDDGFTEHVQIMKIGEYRVLMTAEVDARDGDGNPVEIKLIKQGLGGTKVFFQMLGSGSTTLCKGKNVNQVLETVKTVPLNDVAKNFAEYHDATSLEQKLIRNMERLKEIDHRGKFKGGKVYRIDFNPNMQLHPVRGSRSLLPPESVVKELLGITP